MSTAACRVVGRAVASCCRGAGGGGAEADMVPGLSLGFVCQPKAMARCAVMWAPPGAASCCEVKGPGEATGARKCVWSAPHRPLGLGGPGLTTAGRHVATVVAFLSWWHRACPSQLYGNGASAAAGHGSHSAATAELLLCAVAGAGADAGRMALRQELWLWHMCMRHAYMHMRALVHARWHAA